MSSANRQRRMQNREARIAAEEAARHRAKRQRFTVVLSALGLAVVVALAVVVHSHSSSGSGSKPCVAEKGPAPKGAPAVPVEVGPAPKKLVIKDLHKGTGAVVKLTNTVSVDYIGVACSTGEIFDSSYKSGQPASFPLNGVITGWQDGIPGMRVGGERLLGIPSDEAYGPTGGGNGIGPNEALWFVVKVLSAK